MQTFDTPGGFVRAPTGTEAAVCELIARRQALGVKKYGTTVRENVLTIKQWHQHHLEELLDAAIYVKRIIEQMEREEGEVATVVEQVVSELQGREFQ